MTGLLIIVQNKTMRRGPNLKPNDVIIINNIKQNLTKECSLFSFNIQLFCFYKYMSKNVALYIVFIYTFSSKLDWSRKEGR